MQSDIKCQSATADKRSSKTDIAEKSSNKVYELKLMAMLKDTSSFVLL